MHRIVLLIFVSSVFFSCNIRNTKNKPDVVFAGNADSFKDTTTVKIIDSSYNFGKVTDGEKEEYNFKFRNTGKKPLIIYAASASCGCTVPEKPEAPIPPGELGFLKVVFNSKGRVGDIHKDINVRSNAVPAFPVLQVT